MSVVIPVNIRLFTRALWCIYTGYPVIMLYPINMDFFGIIIHVRRYKDVFPVALFRISPLMLLGCYDLAPIVAQIRSARYSLLTKNTVSCARYSGFPDFNMIGFNILLILCRGKSGIQGQHHFYLEAQIKRVARTRAPRNQGLHPPHLL